MRAETLYTVSVDATRILCFVAGTPSAALGFEESDRLVFGVPVADRYRHLPYGPTVSNMDRKQYQTPQNRGDGIGPSHEERVSLAYTRETSSNLYQ